jgi:hypothetical protein
MWTALRNKYRVLVEKLEVNVGLNLTDLGSDRKKILRRIIKLSDMRVGGFIWLKARPNKKTENDINIYVQAHFRTKRMGN